MKLNMLHAAAFAMTLTASSAQAFVVGPGAAQATIVYDAPPDTTCCTSYGPQTSGSLSGKIVDLWGDYIEFELGTPRNLTRATFWLNTNLADPTAFLTLSIEDDTNPIPNPLAFSGSWSNVGNAYSYTFSQPLSVPTERISYNLILDTQIASSLNATTYLQLFASTGPTTGTDVFDGLPGELPGDVNVGFVGDPNGHIATLAGVRTIAARFEAVPEPATLALLSLGLAGLGFARRRKTAD